MKLLKRGQKGFTLIELLIVVAILGVLAAVVIPNIGQFIGAGESEARETEFATIQSSVFSMMVDNEISSIPNAIAYTTPAGGLTNAVNNMTAFPDTTSAAGGADKLTDPEGYAYDATNDTDGYTLYGHDKTGETSGDPNPNQVDANYTSPSTSTYYYTCEADGTIRQWETADTTATGTEYIY